MADESLTQEERILRMMKKVITDIAKDTSTQPGFQHPLSEGTIQGMRECLALISARERELAAERGATSGARPRFTDEPAASSVVNFKPRKGDADH
jgi:hypothetical protein